MQLNWRKKDEYSNITKIFMDLERGKLKPGVNQENKERQKGVFVDVGFGDYPVLKCGKRVFGEDEIYLGLELDREKVDDIAEEYEGNTGIQFKKIEGDQDEFRFPVADGTVTEVHIGNVFGIPGAVNTHNLQLVLEESIRILKEGGTLSVLETLTPNYSRDYFEEILKRYNLRITSSITPNSPEWEQIVSEYYHRRDWDSDSWKNEYYFIKAEKLAQKSRDE